MLSKKEMLGLGALCIVGVWALPSTKADQPLGESRAEAVERMASEALIEAAAVNAMVSRADTTKRDSVLLAQEWIRRTRADLGKTANGELFRRIANDIYLDSITTTLEIRGAVDNLLVDRLTDPLTQKQKRRFASLGIDRTAPVSASVEPGAAQQSQGSPDIELVEPNASIHASMDLVKAAVANVLVNGYACETVSGIFTPQFSAERRVTLYCNHDTYKYLLRDVGGKWIVEAL